MIIFLPCFQDNLRVQCKLLVNLVPLHGSLLFPFKNMVLHFTKETFVMPFVSAMVGSHDYFHLAGYGANLSL